MSTRRADAKRRSHQLFGLMVGLSVAGTTVALPALIHFGAPRRWLLPTAVVVLTLLAALGVQRIGRPGIARLVALAACDTGILFFHFELGPQAQLSLASGLLVLLTFPLFRTQSRPTFAAALALQGGVLAIVVGTSSFVSGALGDPALAVRFARVVTALELPLLAGLLHQLWSAFVQADQSMERSQDRWEQLLSTAPVDVLVVGADHRIESSNRADRPDLAPGMPLAGALGGYSPGRLLARLGRSGGETDEGLILAGCGPSGDRSVRVHARALLERRCLVMMDDVTDRRRERAALKAAKESAVLAEESRTRLMDRLAHELRTPLTLVLGHAEVLRDRDDLSSGELLSGLDEIHASARHLRWRIDDLLHAARSPGEGLVLQTQDVDLQPFAQEVLAVWDGPATVRNVRLKLEVAVELDLAVLDPAPTRRILWHLLDNAVRYAPGGTVVLAVRREEDRLVFAVSDDGVGIPDGLHDRVLEPFVQQGEASQAGGLGLGLATSRQRARSMGGDLRLSPRPGGGTIATLTLPYVPGEDAYPATESLSDPSLGRRRALVVDDVLLNAEIAAGLLDDEGFDTVFCTDPHEGLKRGQTERFDLAIIDCHMPGLSGYQLVEALRADPGPNPDVPLVALTVDDSPECAWRCQDAGFVRRLLKPMAPRTLRQMLSSLSPGVAPAAARTRPQDQLLDMLRQEFGVGPFLVELIQTWKSSTQVHCTELVEACAGRQRAAVISTAHAMTSPAGTLGAFQLAALTASLEEAGPNDPWPALESLVAQVRAEAASVSSRVEQIMEDAA